MKKLLFAALLLALVATGCAITDYPVITDSRGSYNGVIRTGHKAYIVPSSQVATIWNDGTDELYTMVYQNQYGDQKLYTQNNFDPTGAIIFLDQTYCDWHYQGCEAVLAWNPVNVNVDSVFDYDWNLDCSGARSLSLLVSYTSRIGECGDGLWADKQNLAAEFANLSTTNWRGSTAYVVPMNAANTSITLTTGDSSTAMPMFGQTTGFITEKLQFVLPMTANTRHQLRWLSGFVAENGNRASVTFGYGALSATIDMAFAAEGISYNLNRY